MDTRQSSRALAARPVNRADVIAEVYPGAANDMETHIAAGGGLVCEQHPEKDWPHDDCAGPGMRRVDVGS